MFLEYYYGWYFFAHALSLKKYQYYHELTYYNKEHNFGKPSRHHDQLVQAY